MFVSNDELTILFHEPNYKLHQPLRVTLQIVAMLSIVFVLSVVLLLLYIQVNSPILLILIFVPLLVLMGFFQHLVIRLGWVDYLIALDEAAHYLVMKQTYRALTHDKHWDLHDIKKFDLQQKKNYLLMQLHLANGENAELEVPNEKVANHIRNEIRRVLQSDQPPDLEQRKRYDLIEVISLMKTTDNTAEAMEKWKKLGSK